MAVELEQSDSCCLQSSQYIGEISALSLLHFPHRLSSLPYLLAGSGSQLLVYDLELGNMVNSFDVFHGIRVHGISSSNIHSSKIAIFGEKRVKLYSLGLAQIGLDLTLLQSLPKFDSWVLDVCFLKGHWSSSQEQEANSHLVVGCSDNSVLLWDMSNSSLVLHVQSPDRSLLYSMRLWGNTDSLEALRIASGTIYNEIIVWKMVPRDDGMPSSHFYNYEAVHICKLVGHEGSIFRLTWSSDGAKLVSVSDDRSARIWEIEDKPSESVGISLFGHSARVWDCCVSDSLIVTAGEDCTCRVWGLDGKQLHMIKEHLGRGIWRCLYDPKFSILITAGFDSSIKVHQLQTSLSGSPEGHAEAKEIDRTNKFSVCIPRSSDHIGLTDSKSEYVRCLRFSHQDTLYVSTNNGYLYHAKLSHNGDVCWTKIVRASEKVPIVCMDLLSKPSKPCYEDKDWIAVGDGKGNMTVVRVSNVASPNADITLTWSAEKERQLLGTHWCKPLGYNYVFTADPRGALKLWRLWDPSQPFPYNSSASSNVSLIAEFTSCFGMRIMCLDASVEDEVLVCGDIRGNLVLFPLLKSVLESTIAVSDMKIAALSYFKGAHGISSVTSVSVSSLNSNQIEMRSTGGDGCICYLEYGIDRQNLEFIGMKQVKELSLIQSVCSDNKSDCDSSIAHFAAGFASVDFMIWNLKNETKVLQIPCGGWRRPHSYYVGDQPEIKNCFAYVKDEVIHIHRHWEPEGLGKIYPLNLHMQFHGREMHSLCFITEELQPGAKHSLLSRSSWIATGCEDGTVRLTRYTPGVENWSESKLLGEHVGGSAVRSICYTSRIHVISSDLAKSTVALNKDDVFVENIENPFLLISVGAKRVLTSWLLRNRKLHKTEDSTLAGEQHNATENGNSSEVSSSMSFQWLSTDMPPKYSSSDKYTKSIGKETGLQENVPGMKADEGTEDGKMELKSCTRDKCEDDWRYLAVTAFLVKYAGSRLTICFVVVACSDATLTLRALVLPHRLWFDVALMVSLSSPVLALQHVIIPTCLPSKENIQDRSVYIVISGATDGSVAFWDISESIETFMCWVSVLHVEKFIDCQKRPRTGRGSQGGRWWRSIGRSMSKNSTDSESITDKAGPAANLDFPNFVKHEIPSLKDASESSTTTSFEAIHVASNKSELDIDDSSSEICKICPSHVLKNLHQSGVNCLHVSDVKGCQSPDNGFVYNVLSGGDDQALHYLSFDLEFSSAEGKTEIITPEVINPITGQGCAKNFVKSYQNQNHGYRIRFLNRDKVLSAHSSAVKGVWTDGLWVFSTGLDQRIRCWRLGEQGKITEKAYVIISVPEPEALDARICSRGYYQIAVAGRGMQIAEFWCNS
ncbi:tRNA (34-2'-O)-methyltransferase regulator trm734 [Cannabis sativa]|uniref:tRNA (34-2'-O)-methyltransferase regulator trm734 n=1 Tax=Cannabis sativa TaxID=3483 RepID=UPI0029CA7CB1|nr:tRNA (34-2'-O)-methyltransferase regulator trm734 [Cannabis sativa]